MLKGMKSNRIIIFWVLLLLAVVARIIFCTAVIGFHAPLRGDEEDYHNLAVSLSEGNGFAWPGGRPTAKRPPLYPVLLAGVYSLFGEGYGVGRVFQIILGVLVVLLIFLLAGRFFSGDIPLLAMGVVAVNPFLIFISGYLLTENLYICLMLASIILLTGALRSSENSKRRFFYTGLVMGLCVLARPAAILMAGLLFLVIVVVGRGRLTGRLARGAVFIAAAVMITSVWAVRNRVAMGESVMFTTHGGITFYQGNNPVVYREDGYRGGVAPHHTLPGWDKIRRAEEVESDRLAWEMGMEYVRRNPGKFLSLAASRFARTWRLKSDVGLSGVGSGWWWDKNRFLGRLASSLDAGYMFSVVIIPLFLAGVVLTAGKYKLLMPLYSVILVHTLIAMIFFGSLRARIPVEPVMAIFASAGFFGIIRLIRGGVFGIFIRSV